jgi:hypothetical protein
MLEDLVHNVEANLWNLGRVLWPTDPQTQRHEEAQRVAAELRRCQEALRQAGNDRAAAQRRLKGNRDLIERLPALIQRCLRDKQSEDAWRHALALDRARQEIEADEAAVPRLGQVCWSLRFQVRQLERRLGLLRQRLATT